MKTHNILSINEFKTNIERNSRLLGIDPGNKNLGIAICDENQIVATPLKTIQKKNFDHLIREINEIISENGIGGVIVGNPINMDGSIGRSAQSALDFSKNLSKNITIPIAMWDDNRGGDMMRPNLIMMQYDIEFNLQQMLRMVESRIELAA